MRWSPSATITDHDSDELAASAAVERELMLATVKATPEQRSHVVDLVGIFDGQIIDVGATSLTLMVAGSPDAIDAVIAYAPRCYVALEQNRQNNFGDPAVAAAWTWRGQPVEGVPLPAAMRARPDNPSYEDLHGIAVERIAGPVMLVSGAADTGLAGTTATFSCAHAMRRLARSIASTISARVGFGAERETRS